MSADLEWPAHLPFEPYGVIYDPVTGWCEIAFHTLADCEKQIEIWKRRPRFYTRYTMPKGRPYAEMILRLKARAVNSTDEYREIKRRQRDLSSQWVKEAT